MGNKGKKLFYFSLMGSLFLSLVGCSVKGEKNPDEKQVATEAPIYERSTSQFKLLQDANPYMIECTQNGFYYFAMGEKEAEENTDGDGELEIVYQFFHQTYDGKDAIPFCEVTNGVVRDFSGVAKDSGNGLTILLYGDEACILEFDEAGDHCGKIVIDKRFNNIEEIMELLALPDGGFVIGMGDDVFCLNADGQITKTFQLEGTMSKLIARSENELFAVVMKNEEGSIGQCLAKLNVQKEKVEVVKDLEKDLMGLFVFEDGFVSVYGDRVIFFHPDKEDEEVLIDLNKQSLLASEMQYIFGNREEIKIVSMNEGYEGCLFALKEAIGIEGTDNSKEPEEQLYAPDGRRIVRVAVPQEYYYQIEFHAKKYNQTSEKVYVEVERFEGSLETFLGKGNRPDVIMLNDQTEVASYVQKDAIVDLIPLFQAQEKYSLEGVIPKVRELLGVENGDGMYAMVLNFRMLLRTSDGMEYDSNGKCDAVSYLKWYDKFMTENEIDGLRNIEFLLYANIVSFYDENLAEGLFTTEAFKELMQTYKYVYDRHKGDMDSYTVQMEKGYKVVEIAIGPRWYATYCCQQMTEPNVKMEGLPGLDGENHVYMKFEYPMSIMSTSECKEEAFDFIMYYNSLTELLMVGNTESVYGKSGNTTARFSVYEEILKQEIYESELPYLSSDIFFTDEQKAQLKDLIDSAVSNTKTQNDIYTMLMEEMDVYLKGGKDLDSVCEILQNRAELYMKEKK